MKHTFKYNGNELSETNGHRWYDFGARMYDNQLGTCDVPAKQFVSPYLSFCRGIAIVSSSISLFELGIALDKGEYGKAAKSGLDATMGWVATCGLPGLIIGGRYFVLDAMGVFSQPDICTPFREIHYYYPQNDNTNIKPYNNP